MRKKPKLKESKLLESNVNDDVTSHVEVTSSVVSALIPPADLSEDNTAVPLTDLTDKILIHVVSFPEDTQKNAELHAFATRCGFDNIEHYCKEKLNGKSNSGLSSEPKENFPKKALCARLNKKCRFFYYVYENHWIVFDATPHDYKGHKLFGKSEIPPESQKAIDECIAAIERKKVNQAALPATATPIPKRSQKQLTQAQLDIKKLAKKRNVVVLGAPGSGKTTTATAIASEAQNALFVIPQDETKKHVQSLFKEFPGCNLCNVTWFEFESAIRKHINDTIPKNSSGFPQFDFPEIEKQPMDKKKFKNWIKTLPLIQLIPDHEKRIEIEQNLDGVYSEITDVILSPQVSPTYLSKADYLKRSKHPHSEIIYMLFNAYKEYLKTSVVFYEPKLHDIEFYQALSKFKQEVEQWSQAQIALNNANTSDDKVEEHVTQFSDFQFDWLFIDEIQCADPIQIASALLMLHPETKPSAEQPAKGHYYFCGDANQTQKNNGGCILVNVEQALTMGNISEPPTRCVLDTILRFPKSTQYLTQRILNYKLDLYGSVDKNSSISVRFEIDESAKTNVLDKISVDDAKKYIGNSDTIIIVPDDFDLAEAKQKFQGMPVFHVENIKGGEAKRVILYGFDTQFEKQWEYISKKHPSIPSLGQMPTNSEKENPDTDKRSYEALIQLYEAITRSTDVVLFATQTQSPFLDQIIQDIPRLQSFEDEATASTPLEWLPVAVKYLNSTDLAQQEIGKHILSNHFIWGAYVDLAQEWFKKIDATKPAELLPLINTIRQILSSEKAEDVTQTTSESRSRKSAIESWLRREIEKTETKTEKTDVMTSDTNSNNSAAEKADKSSDQDDKVVDKKESTEDSVVQSDLTSKVSKQESVKVPSTQVECWKTMRKLKDIGKQDTENMKLRKAILSHNRFWDSNFEKAKEWMATCGKTEEEIITVILTYTSRNFKETNNSIRIFLETEIGRIERANKKPNPAKEQKSALEKSNAALKKQKNALIEALNYFKSNFSDQAFNILSTDSTWGNNANYVIQYIKICKNNNLTQALVDLLNRLITLSDFNDTTILSALISGGVFDQATIKDFFTAVLGINTLYVQAFLKKFPALIHAVCPIETIKNENYAALHHAVEFGLEDMVCLLLAEGANIEAVTALNCTALHIASNKGFDPIINLLLLRGANVNVFACDKSTPLHVAAARGHLNSVKLLLNKGADINSKGQNNYTPLHAAVEYNHENVVLELLTRGAIPSEDMRGRTPAIIAAEKNNKRIIVILWRFDFLSHIEKNNFDDAKSMLVKARRKKEFDDNEITFFLYSALDIAATKGYTHIVKGLLENGVDINVINKNNASALYKAIENGHLNTVKLLIEKGADFHTLRSEGYNALHFAIKEKQKDIIQLLLESGADIHAETNNGCNALHIASKFGCKDLVELFLNRGAKIHATSKEVGGYCALFTSVIEGHKDVAELLLDRGANINTEMEGKRYNALHIASEKGHKAIVELLLNRGVNIESCMLYDLRPLHLASNEGQTDTIELLLTRGANIEASSNDGSTPLHFAVTKGHKNAVALLLRKGANKDSKNAEGVTALQIAEKMNNQEIVDLINNHVNINNNHAALFQSGEQSHSQKSPESTLVKK